MNLLNKLTVKNLKLNKKRTIVTIVGIMLSVALITAVASVYASGLQSLINYEMNEKGAFHVVFFDVPTEDVEVIQNNRAVDTVDLTETIGYAEISSRNEDKPYICLKGFTKSALENLSVNLVDGRMPENNSEILIPTHLKTNGRVTLAIGDEVTFDVGKRMGTDGFELDQHNPLNPADEDGEPLEGISAPESKAYKIVGIMERPAYNIEPFSAPGYTVITFVEESDLTNGADLYIRFTKSGVKNAYKFTANMLGIDETLFTRVYRGEMITDEDLLRLSDEVGNAKYNFDFNSHLITLETDPFGISAVTTLAYAVMIVIAIIVVTSVFCIKNSFDISITEKIRQYGMLRSIGATKKQIRKNVFFEATLLGAFGIPLGILLGFLASYILIIVSNLLIADSFAFGFSLSFVFSWTAVLAAVLLGIVTIYFSAFRSAIKASKVTPLDSVRNSAYIKVNSRKLSSPKIIKKIFGMGGEISYKNLKRNRSKYRTTVISIVVSVVVFISLSAFMSMAFDEADREIELTEYNISLTASYVNDDEYNKLIGTTDLENIQNFSTVRTAEIEFCGNHYNKEYSDWLQLMPKDNEPQYISLASVGDEQFAKFCMALGLDPGKMENKAILCDYTTVKRYDESSSKTDNKYMRVFDFKNGDTVIGLTENALTENKISVQVEIAAVSENKPFGLKNRSSPFLFVSDETFDGMAETTYVNIYYKTDNSDKLQDEIEAQLKDMTYNLNNTDEHFRQMNNLYTLIGIFLYGFIIVISLIGVTNIFNTITTNIELRKPEFAMLRSVGMTNKEFNRMIRLESLFMGTRSLLFGVPIGILLSYVIYHFLAEESGYPFELPTLSILIAIAAVFVLISLIMAYSMGKVKKQNTIETIRSENI